MLNSYANLPTTEAARLIKRLCAHWGHKFSVDCGTDQGRIDFGTSQCQLIGHTNSLHIHLQCPDEETTGRMQGVVFDHLQRMGKHPLQQPSWTLISEINHVG